MVCTFTGGPRPSMWQVTQVTQVFSLRHIVLVLAMIVIWCGTPVAAAMSLNSEFSPDSIFQFTVKDIEGVSVNLGEKFKGKAKAFLIVNVGKSLVGAICF
jgi:hypothetical protein